MQISQEQNDIIQSNKNTIVVSNPGTGKTTTLSLKVIKLLESRVKPENILCITFTEKAKKEMFDTIFSMAKGKFPDSDIMKLNIHTFHSFAYNYLVDSGLISGDIVGNNILRFSILESFEKNKALHYSKDYIISEIMPKTENAIRYIKSFGITPDKIDIPKATSLLDTLHNESSSYSLDEMKAFLKYFVDAYKDYEISKLEAIDYSGMLLIFIEKFKGKKFEHVLVDEMQDMNEIEAKITVMVAENLFLVGDSKQAIFGFQGGSVKNLNRFMQICDLKLLSMNRRSSQQILDYSKNYFLERTQYKEMFEKELEYFKSQANGQIPKIISTSAHLSKILDVIEENPGKSIGIIIRTNRRIIEISQYLDTNNIKYSSTSSQATAQQAKDEILSFIKGQLSDRIEDKISATFTIFAPFSLKEAFDLSLAYKNKDSEKLAKIKSWGITMNREDLDVMFDSVLFPLCISKGSEWFSTAMLVKQQIVEYLSFEIPTLEGMFDFIAIGEESYIERSNESKITLTTVHKAKGRAFDVVVYMPSTSRKTSFIDTITQSILISSEIDIKGELEEESLRIDFVAFTRAKEKLIIIADDKNSKNYHIENLSELEVDDRKDDLIATRLNNRLSEAFSLFVAGRFQDSEKLLKEEEVWLEEYILNYFKNIDHFSYSSIKTKPYEFLTENIIKIPRFYAATNFGLDVHNAFEKIMMNQAKIDDFDDDVKKAVQNGLNAIESLKKQYPGLIIESVEKKIDLPLSSMTKYDDGPLKFTGKIDALFKHDNGYLIIDYKTDKNDNYSSEHKQQLSVYRKMYSLLEGIPEEKIGTCIIFVALRGSINTGKFDWLVDSGKRNVYPTFEKHLQVVLEWKKNPKKFIEDLLGDPQDYPLYQAIEEKLTHSSSK